MKLNNTYGSSIWQDSWIVEWNLEMPPLSKAASDLREAFRLSNSDPVFLFFELEEIICIITPHED